MNRKLLFFIAVCLNIWTAASPQDTCGNPRDSPCPSDMAYFDGSCYKWTGVQSSVGWASPMCTSIGSHLPIIKSQAQQDFLNILTKGAPILLGLMQDDKDTPWEWIDGDSYSYRNFNQMLDFGRSTWHMDCAAIGHHSTFWFESRCYYTRPSLCQIPAEDVGSCRGTYADFLNMCYFQNSQKMTFYDHAEFCESQNASMLTIPNKAVNDFILSLNILTHSIIGLYQRDDADEFLWEDGTNADGFNRWAEGQPDDRRMEQDCAVIQGGGFWFDEECSYINADVVCQRAVTCQLERLDPTWSSVSRKAATVDEDVKVTCQDGMFHPVLWKKHFYLTCIKNLYIFQSCVNCVAGCQLDIMYGSNNICPLEQRGLLEGETLSVECRRGHAMSSGDTIQNITCTDGLLSSVEMCNPTNAAPICDLNVDWCVFNIEDPGVSVLRDTDTLTLSCAAGCHMGKGVKTQTVTCDTKDNLQACNKGNCQNHGCE